MSFVLTVYISFYRTRRTGVLALKIGVIPQWRKDGTKIETTLLQVGSSNE